MRKGFTLVELSIALVIVGLLIGGVLVGKNIIDSVEVQRLVNDFRQYEVATNQFYRKFKKYPGDSQFFTPPGNADDILGWGPPPTPCTGTLWNQETSQFWAHLSQAQILKANYPAYASTACGGTHTTAEYNVGKYTPYTKINAEAIQSGMAGAYTSNNRAISVYKSSASSKLYFQFYVLPLTALGLDEKLGSSPKSCVNISAGYVSCGASSAVLSWVYFYPTLP